MAYRLVISEEAREQLRSLPAQVRRTLDIASIAFTSYKSDSREIFRNSKASEVTSACGLEVTASSFRMEANAIEVYAVKQRKDAYE